MEARKIKEIKKCEICGRLSDEYRVGYHELTGKILCEKHKMQYKRYGRFMEQTRFEPNNITIEEEVAYIGLNDFYGNIVDEAIIDTKNVDKIKGYKWFKRKDGRVVANVTNKNKSKSTHIRLHNIIMNPPDGFVVDHIKGNTLDNRESMLRNVTEKQNSCNNTIQSNNTSGVVGVVKAPYNGWIPQIKKNKKMIRLGSDKSFDVAVKRRLKAECEYFGEYSRNYNQLTNTIQLTYKSHDDNIETFIEVDLNGNIIKFEKLEGDIND